MTDTTLTITGMHCDHCVMHVRKALAGVPGVQVKKVEIGKATLAYDPAQATLDTLKAAVAEAGYDVAA
jgi:copper chaperone CopZ